MIQAGMVGEWWCGGYEYPLESNTCRYFRIDRLNFRRAVGGCLSILATITPIGYFVGDLTG